MHDTAMRIGSLAMQIYAPQAKPRILELGSYNVNGSLREEAPAGARYTGIDIEVGPGVDIVVEPGAALPFPDASFDLVVASSVLEHDPAFWVTLLEMARSTRPGGFIYINCPSNGVVHRYPQDNWRFYPDCGRALERWANSQGLQIELVESFTAERQADIWNDFVAVFRRLPAKGGLPQRRIHEYVPCTNVLTGSSDTLGLERLETEDMVLLAKLGAELPAALDGAAAAQATITKLSADIEMLGTRLAAVERENSRLSDKAALLENRAERQYTTLSREIAHLEEQVARAEATAAHMAEEADWMHEAATILAMPRPRWWAVLPRLAQERQLDRRVSELRAFDADRYLADNPDVCATARSALVHYLRHGWKEGRARHSAA